MPPEKRLAFRIGAEDDSSKIFSKMAGNAKREMGKIQDELDETQSAGKRMAKGIWTVADQLEAELKGTERAADKLSQALGPEFVARAGGNVDRFVDDLRAAGLTFDDIETEAEELAAAIKRLEDAGQKAGGTTRQSFDDVNRKVKDVGDTTDRTNSVFANFAGNAAQDLPGISGSFGALNVAAGQFAEYATEGGIGIRQMAMAVGPIALLTVAIAAVSSQFQKQAESAKFTGERIDNMVESMRNGKTALEAFNAEVAEAGKLQTPFASGVKDVTAILANAGVSYEEFTRATQMSKDEILEWGRTIGETGTLGGFEHIRLLHAVFEAKEQMAKATDIATQRDRVYGDTVEEVNAKLDKQRKALDDAKAALEAKQEATLAAINSDFGYHQSIEGVSDALDAMNEATAAAAEATGEDLPAAEEAAADAIDSTVGAMLGQAAAAVQLATDQAAASGATLTAEDRARIYKEELIKLAAQFPDLAGLLQGYIDKLNAIPKTVHTQVSVTQEPLRLSGPRAHGGPVAPHKAYLVGEQGPEVLAMGSQGGTVIPNHQLRAAGGSGGASASLPPIIVNVHGTASKQDAQEVVDALTRWQRSNGPLPITTRSN